MKREHLRYLHLGCGESLQSSVLLIPGSLRRMGKPARPTSKEARKRQGKRSGK